MAYSSQVVRRARSRLAQANEERQRQLREHLQEAYRQQPQLWEIDRQLRLTMAKAAQAAFAGGDAQAILAQARAENQALQARRRSMVETCFPQGYLEDAPLCPDCGGSGYVGSSMCRCLMELCRQEQMQELTVLSAGAERFDQFRLDYYSAEVDPRLGVSPRQVMEKTYQTCLRYASTFTMEAGNLLFSGNTGLGKTFLSACIAAVVSQRGYSVVYESAGRLFSAMERARFDSTEENRSAVAKYHDCDLLIVDDLGTELPGQFVTAALYTLLNDRLLEGKPTIISTNLATEDLPRRYSPQIASRLRGSFRRVAFMGEDIRILKNRGKLG